MVAHSPSVVTNGVLHAPLEVSASQVMLADVHVSHGCVLQLLGKGFPGLQADFKVLSSIQGPDAPLLQDLCQPQELLIKHALQKIKQALLKTGSYWQHVHDLCQMQELLSISSQQIMSSIARVGIDMWVLLLHVRKRKSKQLVCIRPRTMLLQLQCENKSTQQGIMAGASVPRSS